MHFSKSFLAAAITLATTILAQEDPEYTLHINATTLDPQLAPNWLETGFVSYANSSIWIGDIHYQTYSEPFSVRGLFSFTSYHASPTGGQGLYIYPNETLPVKFTVPHGGYIPENATSTGFAFDATTGYLKWGGLNNFWGCENAEESLLRTYQIWWFGAGEPNGVSCVGPLDLYADYSCDTGY